MLTHFTKNSLPPLQKPSPVTSQKSSFNKFHKIDKLLERYIRQKRIPGAIVRIENKNHLYQKAYGYKSILPKRIPMELDTIFDLASLTKVVATTTSIALLFDQGKLSFDDRIEKWIPGFKVKGKGSITIKHLLTHTSGLRAGLGNCPKGYGPKEAIREIKSMGPRYKPGTRFKYSDLNFIVLGEIVSRASGMPLDKFSRKKIFKPLGMMETRFIPHRKRYKAKLNRIAPTACVNKKILIGTAQDPTVRIVMKGVAGHAGLFSTVGDLGIFAQMMLDLGKIPNDTSENKFLLKPETVKTLTRSHTAKIPKIRRGLGWDIKSPYSSPKGRYFSSMSYGHTGWTGASIWLDPKSGTSVILITNRLHPFGQKSVTSLRYKISTLAAEAIKK